MRNTCQPSVRHSKSTVGTQNTQKKNEVQTYTALSHSLSDSLSPFHKKTKHKKTNSNLFSKKIQKTIHTLSLSLSFRACRFVAGTVADCSRRRRCFSLPSPSLLLAPVTVAYATSRRRRRCFSLPSPSPTLPLAVTSRTLSFFFKYCCILTTIIVC